MSLTEELKNIISTATCDADVRERYQKRLPAGNLTRDENNQSHFCAYFLPYNPHTGEIFLVHHKKAGLWLSPGGHIDRGENLLTTLNREIEEELGVAKSFQKLPQPFLLSITPIQNTTQPCKEHFDVWFLFQTDGKNFQINPREFHDTKWAAPNYAKSILTDAANLKAMDFAREMRRD